MNYSVIGHVTALQSQGVKKASKRLVVRLISFLLLGKAAKVITRIILSNVTFEKKKLSIVQNIKY